MYKRNKTLEAEIEGLNRGMEEAKERHEKDKQAAVAAAAAAAAAEGAAGGGKGSGAKVKKSNSVRAKLFKMTLHSESQC